MFNFLANLNPQELLAALDELRASAAQMKCLEDRLAAIQRLLEYEFGQPVRDVPAHDPRNLPFVVQIAAGRVDLQAGLGKPATRGHIVNIGEARAAIWFETGAQRVGPYYLLPAAALDLSWALEILEVREAGEGPVKVQLLMQ